MKAIFFLFIINEIIVVSLNSKDLCSPNYNCKDCDICGKNSDYCSCNFYNGFCLNDTKLIYNTTFLIKYNECLSNPKYNICGNSFISLDIGQVRTINLKATNKSNIECYYNFKKSTINNAKMIIKILNINIFPIQFQIFYITYDNNYNIKNESPDIFGSDNSLEIIESNCQQISFYLIFNNSDLYELSLIFSIENEIPQPETREIDPYFRTTPSHHTSNNIGIIIGIIVGGTGIISCIIIIIICVKKKRKKIIKKK